MNRILVTLFAAIAATAVSAAPAGNRFRIDMQGEKGLGMVYKNGSEGTTGSQAGWLKEKKDTRLIVTGPISQEWKEFSFTFVPKADGKVSINLMSDNPKFQVSYDNIRVTLDMVNGVYTGTRIPFFGSITFYLQDDYGILGMSAIAYCIIAYEIYSGFNDKLRENRIKTYDSLFKEGVSKITYSSPDGTIEFDANYQGSIDKKKKSGRVDIKYTRSSAK